MKRILVTGATGTVGEEVIRFLLQKEVLISAGVRKLERGEDSWSSRAKIRKVKFDFEDPSTFDTALAGVDTVFLLRPPQLSKVSIFEPFLDVMSKRKIAELVFLSVQGAESSSWIPHRKIEKLILKKEVPYVFLRPGYFMQNLTTVLLPAIREKKEIALPAGKADFNWTDVRNLGEVAAEVLSNFEEYQGKAIDITGYNPTNFYEVAALLSEVTGRQIRYRAVNPFRFFSIKRKEGYSVSYIVVMFILHFLPRFQDGPPLSKAYEEITGNSPTTLEEFIRREKSNFAEK